MSEINSASFPLYTAHGIRVHFTVPFDGNGAAVSAVIDRLLNDGYMVNAVGLEANEEREVIGWVVRYNQANKKDGSITPRIFFYPAADNLVHKEVDRYLNTGEDVAEFERVSGLQVSKLPAWVAGGAPKRTDANAASFVVPVAKPFAVVKRPNPDYKGEGDKEHTKYLFVRYEPVATTPPPSPSASTAGTATGNAGASREPKVINGSDPAVFGELFPASAVNVVTLDALYARVAGLFNAKQHFSNWWAQHEDNLLKHTTNEAEDYARALRWNWDKEQVQAFLDKASDWFSMNTGEVIEALSEANGKKIAKWRDWDAGTINHAYGAVLAWESGYDTEDIERIAKQHDIDDLSITLAAGYCAAYQAKHRETA